MPTAAAAVKRGVIGAVVAGCVTPVCSASSDKTLLSRGPTSVQDSGELGKRICDLTEKLGAVEVAVRDVFMGTQPKEHEHFCEALKEIVDVGRGAVEWVEFFDNDEKLCVVWGKKLGLSAAEISDKIQSILELVGQLEGELRPVNRDGLHKENEAATAAEEETLWETQVAAAKKTLGEIQEKLRDDWKWPGESC